MTQQVFAEFIGTSPATLSGIFNGRTNPTLAIVELIKKKIPDINTDWLMFGSGQMYILRAVGDSMEDAGIRDGDYVVITRQNECNVGDLVIALDGEGQNTLKAYGGVDEASGCAVLEYRNRSVYGDKRILVRKLVLQGVVKNVIKVY